MIVLRIVDAVRMARVGMNMGRLRSRVRMRDVGNRMRVRRQFGEGEGVRRLAAGQADGVSRVRADQKLAWRIGQIEIRPRAAEGVADRREQLRVSRRVERGAVADRANWSAASG